MTAMTAREPESPLVKEGSPEKEAEDKPLATERPMAKSVLQPSSS
jgi:hypothetical protein